MGEHIPCVFGAVAVLFGHRLIGIRSRINVNLPALLYWERQKQVFIMSKASQFWSQVVTLLVSFSFIAPLAAAPAAKLPTAGERWVSMEKAEVPSFRRHVVPLMSRSGCSGRECHGSFAGQGGFQLSLFGYDFEKDHHEITADKEDGIRIEKENPAQSLVLLKATNEEKHKGKERIKKGSWEYNLLLKWIAEGAKIDVAETGEFDRLEIQPKEIVFKKTGEAVQLKVLAHWKDGTVEDVTQITRFRTNDDTVSNVSDTGEVKCSGPGDTHIVAFYDNGVLPIPVMLPVSDKVGPKYPKVVTRTPVDELVVNKLRKVGIVPSDVAGDTEFLRRVSLDVTGTLPTPSEIREFVADKSSDKRAKKIDELLNRPAYAAWWATQMCDWTGNNAAQLRGAGEKDYNNELSRLWYDWIESRVAKNEPYDKLVAGIVLATGRTSQDQSYEDYAREMSSYLKKENPADIADRPNMPFFWLRQNVKKPQEKALAFAHSFLGVRIECAECHKHPFDQWTKTDFMQFQAFFEPITYGGRKDKEGVTYASMVTKLREMIGEVDKREQKKKMEAEFEKLVRAGEPAPWQELYVNQVATRKLSDKDIARIKAKNPNYNSRVATPKILGGEEVSLTDYPDPRAPLMEWMRDPENAYFARAFVNRVWANYFGRGIVEPADDMNLANPPVNKELMDYLATQFAAKGYDMKWLHREILNSDTYQRTWKPNDTNRLDEKNFSHMVLRRLPAEVAMDAITMATASSRDQSTFAGNIEKRAIGPMAAIGTRKGLSSYSLTTFGKPARLTNCDCERTADPTLLQTLFTRNDPELLTKLEGGSKDSAWISELRNQNAGPEVKKATDELRKTRATRDNLRKRKQMHIEKGTATETVLKQVEAQIAATEEKEKQLVVTTKPPAINQDEIITEIYLRTVSRFPTAAELKLAKEDLAAAKDPVDGVRDVLWAMLNAREFLVNH